MRRSFFSLVVLQRTENDAGRRRLRLRLREATLPAAAAAAAAIETRRLFLCPSVVYARKTVTRVGIFESSLGSCGGNNCYSKRLFQCLISLFGAHSRENRLSLETFECSVPLMESWKEWIRTPSCSWPQDKLSYEDAATEEEGGEGKGGESFSLITRAEVSQVFR